MADVTFALSDDSTRLSTVAANEPTPATAGPSVGAVGHSIPLRPSIVIPPLDALRTVLHDFQARSPDEITLKRGELIEVLEGDEEFGDGWYTGRSLSTNERGLFPQVYTEPVRDMQMHASPAIITPSSSLVPQFTTAVEPSRASNSAPQSAKSIHDSQRSSTRSSSRDSHNSHISISSSNSLDAHAHSPTPPLTVEKVTSGRSTPTTGTNTRERSIVLVGNTVEERAVNYIQGLHSPVVEDTLSDIEEALSEISKGQHSRTKQIISDHNRRHTGMSLKSSRLETPTVEVHDSSSEYSVDPAVQGLGSDIEEDEGSKLPIQGLQDNDDDVPYTKAEVKAWTPAEVSQYLQSRQIPVETCVKFEEQDVSGAILLELEMSHLKELDIGSFGKRFSVWKEIEHLVKNVKPSTKPRSGSDARLSSASYAQRTSGHRQRRSTVGSTVLPRIPSHNSRPASRQHRIDVEEANLHQSVPGQSPQTATTIASSIASPMFGLFEAPRSPPLSPQRRNTISSKRLSVHDTTSPAIALNTALSTGSAVLHAGGVEEKTHQRESSFDKGWSLSLSGGSIIRPSTASGMRDFGKGKHKATPSAGTGDTSFTGDSGFSESQPATPYKASERSYFSSGEAAPRERKVLQKKNGANHEKRSSYIEEQRLRSGIVNNRHSRIGSAETLRKVSPSLSPSHAYHKFTGKDKHKRKSASFSGDVLSAYDEPKLLPSPSTKGTGPQRRVTDEALIGRAMSPTLPPSNLTTPRSISETLAQSTDDKPLTPVSAGPESIDGSTASLTATVESENIEKSPTKATRKSTGKRIRSVSSGSALRTKPKKQTTAYEKGLRQITPADAARDGDFSGWMKKRGSTGVGTWKSRFFVLTGRRLSYFYSETDTKERGLIDITSHKVLPATDDRLIGLHAAFAAVTSPAHSPRSPFSPSQSSPDSPEATSSFKDKDRDKNKEKEKEKEKEEKAKSKDEKAKGKDEKAKDKGEKNEKGEKTEKGEKEKEKAEKDKGWFTFKLVPPAPGAAKGVTFTPPRLHYFATDTREQGKQWMAAIMKATIDRDETKPVVTSYNAKTISLAKARQLRARPPEMSKPEQGSDGSSGLAITGIEFGLAEGEEADDEAGREDSVMHVEPASAEPPAYSEADQSEQKDVKTTAPVENGHSKGTDGVHNPTALERDETMKEDDELKGTEGILQMAAAIGIVG